MTDAVATPASDPEGPFELRVLESLRRIARAIDLHSKRLATAHGITTPQLVVLNTLGTEEALTVSDLARRVHLSASTIVGIVDRLAKKDLVERRRRDPDRRRVHVALTEGGQALVARAPSPLQDRLRAGLNALTDLEQASIALALDRVVALMEVGSLQVAPLLEAGPIPESGSDSTPVA